MTGCPRGTAITVCCVSRGSGEKQRERRPRFLDLNSIQTTLRALVSNLDLVGFRGSRLENDPAVVRSVVIVAGDEVALVIEDLQYRIQRRMDPRGESLDLDRLPRTGALTAISSLSPRPSIAP